MDPDASVAYKPFHNQLRKAEFADFMQAVVGRAMVLFSKQLSVELPSKLKCFEQILLQDGSSFALHPELAEIFPNRFKGNSPAAVECHMTMSLADDQPLKLGLSADTASERDYLPQSETMKNKLLLADAGYVSLEYMAEVERHGGYFLMRSTKQINPTIARALNSKEQEIKSLVGLKLKALAHRRGGRAPVLDLDVTWQHYQCRMVLFWHQEEKRYLWWLTNLPRTKFSAEDIMRLYRVRWQIELLFKEWKSFNNLKRFVTRQEHMVKGLIWASLLSLLVKRFIGRVAQQRLRVRLSMLKLAKSTQGWFEPVMKSLAAKSLSLLRADLSWAI
ncbi:MAG: IS4 family transposase, partial [Shewanella sp.]|nr:IS4 family transposase [Shewanella sp.]